MGDVIIMLQLFFSCICGCVVMSQIQKLIDRFLSRPKDFTFGELTKMLNYFGYTLDEDNSGSRIRFYNSEYQDVILLHKPHPKNIMKSYQLDEIRNKLKIRGVI